MGTYAVGFALKARISAILVQRTVGVPLVRLALPSRSWTITITTPNVKHVQSVNHPKLNLRNVKPRKTRSVAAHAANSTIHITSFVWTAKSVSWERGW